MPEKKRLILSFPAFADLLMTRASATARIVPAVSLTFVGLVQGVGVAAAVPKMRTAAPTSRATSSARRRERGVRALPAPGSLDHHAGAAAQRAAAPHPCAPRAAARGNPTRWQTRPGAARQPARAPLDRTQGAATDRRGARARPRDRSAHTSTGTTAARPAGRRTARRSTTRPLPVTPRDVSTPKPPSPDSPAQHQPPRPPARRSATASTAPATANSTAPCTRSSSHANAHTHRRSPTSNAASQKARPDAKQTAASSATSPATSTAYSNTDRQPSLDTHRSNTGARGRSSRRRRSRPSVLV